MERCVLVTGASSGLGKEIAKKLSDEGYRVFAGVRKEEDKIALESLNSKITAVYLDVTSEASLSSAFEIVSEKTDKLYALVNNAGIALAGPVEYMPISVLQKQYDVNVFGALRCAQTFLPLLEKSEEKRIVNMSSMASYAIFPFLTPYSSSKRMLDILFNALSVEAKIPNLKVISIKPGVVKTPIWDKSVDACLGNLHLLSEEAQKKYEKEFEFLAQNAKKNNSKGLEPEEVANLVAKVLNKKNPKKSYNIGKDSYIARLLSLLPDDIVFSLVAFSLKKKMSK